MKMRFLHVGLALVTMLVAKFPLFSQQNINVWVVNRTSNEIGVFSTNTPYELLYTIPISATPTFPGIAFNPVNQNIYVGVNAGVDVIVNGQTTFTTIALPHPIFGVAVTPTAATPNRVYVNDNVQSAYLIDATTNTYTGIAATVNAGPLSIAITPVAVSGVGPEIGYYAFLPNVSGTYDSISVVDINPSSPQYNQDIDDLVDTLLNGVFAIAFTPNGSKFYVTSQNNNGVLRYITSGLTPSVSLITVGTDPRGIATANTTNGVYAYVANFGSNNISVINTSTDTLVTTIPLSASSTGPEAVAATSDGTTLFVCSSNGALSVIDTATNTLISTVVTPGFANGVSLAMVPAPPQAPSNLTGQLQRVIFATQTEYIHHLQWRPSADSTVVEYVLFRNGLQIAVIPASGPFTYDDQNRRKNESDTYSLISVNGLGIQSFPVTLIFQ